MSLQTWAPSDDPKAHLLILHGYLEHGGRYSELAESLCSKGIAVSAFDFRGHGKSTGERALIRKFKDYHDDLTAALAVVQDKYKDVAKFVLGHSNGGLVAFDYYLLASNTTASGNLKGLILISPYLGMGDKLPWLKFMIAKCLGSLFPSATIASTLTTDQLTSDPIKQKQHDDDPLILKFATLGWGSQVMMTQQRAESVKEITCPSPTLIAYATKDSVADPKLNQEIAERLVAQDKTILPIEGQHEILNEVGRDKLFATIGDWISERI